MPTELRACSGNAVDGVDITSLHCSNSPSACAKELTVIVDFNVYFSFSFTHVVRLTPSS